MSVCVIFVNRKAEVESVKKSSHIAFRAFTFYIPGSRLQAPDHSPLLIRGSNGLSLNAPVLSYILKAKNPQTNHQNANYNITFVVGCAACPNGFELSIISFFGLLGMVFVTFLLRSRFLVGERRGGGGQEVPF